MSVKISWVKDKIVYILVFYMLNKKLWDYYFGSFSKLLYYSLLLLSVSMYIIHIKKTDWKLFISFILYFLVVLNIGLTKSNSDQLSIGLMEYLVYPLPFFAFSWLFSGRKDYSKLIKSIYKWGIVTSTLAIYEYFTKKPILPTNSTNITVYYDGSRSYRASVFIGSPMILAVVLGTLFIIGFYYYHYSSKKTHIIGIILLFLAIICTGSRAPLVSAISGVMFMYLYLLMTGKASNKTVLSLMIGFVIAVSLILFIVLFPDFRTGIVFIDYVISRFSSTFNFTSEWGNVERLTRWSYYLRVFYENPISGIGLATTSAEVLSNAKITAHGITTESGVIARLVETGVIGALSYYTFFFLCVKRALFNIKSNILHGKTTQLLVLGVLVLFLVEDLVLQISLDIFATFILWLMLAYSVNQISLSSMQT